MAETILQSPVLTKFVYPFLLMFFIVFAILEKTKVLGSDKKQINALVAFVIGLIFVSAVYPKMVVENMILFLTIAIIIVFVVLLLWGFVAGEEGLKFEKAPKFLKWVIGIAVVIAVMLATLWATGTGFGFFENLFSKANKTFWTNAFFILIIAAALAAVLAGGKKSG
jgi:hypothetical protein